MEVEEVKETKEDADVDPSLVVGLNFSASLLSPSSSSSSSSDPAPPSSDVAAAASPPLLDGQGDLPHDPLTCLICGRKPRHSRAIHVVDDREEDEVDVDVDVSLFDMNDLLFLVWDYLPLSQVFSFRFLCPKWRELLQLRPGAEQPPPVQEERKEAHLQQMKRTVEGREEEEMEVDGDGEGEDDGEGAVLSQSEEREAEGEDEEGDEEEAEDLEEPRRLRRRPPSHQLQGVRYPPPQRDWTEELQSLSEAELAVILEGPEGGRGGRGALSAAVHARLRRARDWVRVEAAHGRRTLKRRRKVDRRTFNAAATNSAPLTAGTKPPNRETTFTPLEPSWTSPASLHSVTNPASSSSSSSSSSATSPSFSPSPSFVTSSSPSPSSLSVWSSRSYLHRLVHASLSLLPSNTPSLTPAVVASLSSVTSLHLFSFPFVSSVFSCEREGSDWSEEEVRMLTAERETYEREESKKAHEASERERKTLKDGGGDRRERLLLNAAWAMRRGNREDVEDFIHVIEGHAMRPRMRPPRRGDAEEAVAVDDGEEEDVDAHPLRPIEGRLLHLHDRARDRDRDRERDREQFLHPFWYHAALERRPPKDIGHLRLLRSLAPRLTALTFAPTTITQPDLVTLGSLHNLTSLSLQPHGSEGIRPPEAIAAFLSSFPQLSSLSLSSEEATTFPLPFIPHLPILASSLRSLAIHAASFNLEAVHALSCLTSLTSLSLSFTLEPLPSSTFQHLAGLTSLISLSLHTGTRLSYELPPSLFGLSSLTSLSLFGTINVHLSAFHLLPSLSSLQRLRVSDCYASLNDVVEPLLGCAQLRVVDVRGAALSFRKREQIRFERTDVRLIETWENGGQDTERGQGRNAPRQ